MMVFGLSWAGLGRNQWSDLHSGRLPARVPCLHVTLLSGTIWAIVEVLVKRPPSYGTWRCPAAWGWRSINFGRGDPPAASSDVLNICDVIPGGRRLPPSRMARIGVLRHASKVSCSSRFRRPGHPNSVRAVSDRYSRPLARWRSTTTAEQSHRATFR